jgi:Tfp pilus assembly protein PilO
MKQSSKRLFSILIALVFVVVALLALFDFIEPAYGEFEMMKGQLVSDQAFLSQEQGIVTQAQNLLSAYENDTSAENSLALAMPSGPDTSGALAQVYGLATANNLVVQNITVSPPSVQSQAYNSGSTPSAPLTLAQVVKPIGSVALQFSAVGSYENLQNFLVGLEDNIRIFDVTSFSLQPGTAGVKGLSGADEFTSNITATTYYQLQ